MVPKFQAKSVSRQAMEKVFAINYLAVLALSLGLRELLKNVSTACIINLSSGTAKVGFRISQPEYYGHLVCAATKGAVVSLTRGLAKTLAP